MKLAKQTQKGPRALRVLHVLEATGGGTMRYMENIADAVESLDLVSSFAYGHARADSKLRPFLRRIVDRGWQVFPIDMDREIDVPKDLTALRQLRKAVKAFYPDVVHCHSSKAGALGRAAATGVFPRPARLYSPHAVAAPLGSGFLKIEKLFAHMTERFLAVSESERRQIVDLDLAPAHKIDIVYPSIDFAHFAPRSKQEARRALNLDDNAPYMVTIGRLTEQKAPETFIEVVRQLTREHPSLKAIWVGSGSGNQAFCSRVEAAGLSAYISVVPWVGDVRAYLAAADVVLSTSKFESFGYVTAEALAMERPVVASDVTGTCDIMCGSLRKWLYAPGDCATAAKLVSRLLSEPGEADAVSLTGRALMMQHFSTEKMRESLIDAYGGWALRCGAYLIDPARFGHEFPVSLTA